MTLQPEARHSARIADETLVCRHPGGLTERLPLAAISRVLIETNDTGPWGMDVWWIVEGQTPADTCRFPLGATGEDEVLAWLRRLPGFEIRGMNSAANARFECWPHPEAMPV